MLSSKYIPKHAQVTKRIVSFPFGSGGFLFSFDCAVACTYPAEQAGLPETSEVSFGG